MRIEGLRVPPIGPTCQPSCWSVQFGRGSGAHPQEYWGRSRLARLETRVKLLSLALAARETRVKLSSVKRAVIRQATTPWHLPQTLPLPRSWV